MCDPDLIPGAARSVGVGSGHRLRGQCEGSLDTSLKQEDAQRLYERNGFVHVGNVDIGGIASRLYRLTLAGRPTSFVNRSRSPLTD